MQPLYSKSVGRREDSHMFEVLEFPKVFDILVQIVGIDFSVARQFVRM